MFSNGTHLLHFVLSRIVMPSRGRECLKIYYSRLEDLNVRWNWFWTFKFQRKGVPCTRACNFKIATKIAFHPKLHSC